MTEPAPTYTAPPHEPHPLPDDDAPPVFVEGVDILTLYFVRRRDVLIAELREIDRLLGRPQTVPIRRR